MIDCDCDSLFMFFDLLFLLSLLVCIDSTYSSSPPSLSFVLSTLLRCCCFPPPLKLLDGICVPHHSLTKSFDLDDLTSYYGCMYFFFAFWNDQLVNSSLRL